MSQLPALLASALNLTLMQSERPLPLLWHPFSAPLCLDSNLLPLHCICLAPGSELQTAFTPLLPLHPSAFPPPPPLLCYWTLSCCWCGLASRAKWDTMHNYVVRGHHDGNISVCRLHNGSLSLCILLCAVVIKWMLTQSVMPSREIQLVLVFTNLSSCLPPIQRRSLLERFWQEEPLISWLKKWMYF